MIYSLPCFTDTDRRTGSDAETRSLDWHQGSTNKAQTPRFLRKGTKIPDRGLDGSGFPKEHNQGGYRRQAFPRGLQIDSLALTRLHSSCPRLGSPPIASMQKGKQDGLGRRPPLPATQGTFAEETSSIDSAVSCALLIYSRVTGTVHYKKKDHIAPAAPLPSSQTGIVAEDTPESKRPLGNQKKKRQVPNDKAIPEPEPKK